ncbi:unnamed protein product, partial [Rotaria sp. Silwood1]
FDEDNDGGYNIGGVDDDYVGGTTTTFNGYTNITGFPQTIIPPRPAPR